MRWLPGTGPDTACTLAGGLGRGPLGPDLSACPRVGAANHILANVWPIVTNDIDDLVGGQVSHSAGMNAHHMGDQLAQAQGASTAHARHARVQMPLREIGFHLMRNVPARETRPEGANAGCPVGLVHVPQLMGRHGRTGANALGLGSHHAATTHRRINRFVDRPPEDVSAAHVTAGHMAPGSGIPRPPA